MKAFQALPARLPSWLYFLRILCVPRLPRHAGRVTFVATMVFIYNGFAVRSRRLKFSQPVYAGLSGLPVYVAVVVQVVWIIQYAVIQRKIILRLYWERRPKTIKDCFSAFAGTRENKNPTAEGL